MKPIQLIVLCFLMQGIAAQGVLPEDWGLNTYQIIDPELGDINYYISQNGIDQDKPLLFIVSGARGLPVSGLSQSWSPSSSTLRKRSSLSGCQRADS